MRPESSFPFNIVFNKTSSNKKATQLIETIEFSSKAYFNLKEMSYEDEVWFLNHHNIEFKPALKGTPKFKEILDEKVDFKWVYTIYRELLIAPMYINKIEIAHSLIAENKPVFAAGCGEWKKNILEINNYTGHYEVKPKSFRIHCQVAWNKAGVKYTPFEKTF